jgi:probable F420-dependent oxidoreductase
MLVSIGLPTHLVDDGDEFVSAEAIAELSQVAERAGFSAVSVTDHPFPTDAWLAHGGHHAIDPFVSLAFAAAATSTVRLHTNLLVVAYRNPWLAAQQVATLDRLSGGRMILGIGAGYLEGEFDALGVDFATRNERTDESIRMMRQAWTGESIDGNTMSPTPTQPGGPPIWIGGNSRRAIRRAVELADGWSPFPSGPPKAAKHTRTTSLMTPDDLRASVDYAREHAAAVGRTAPLDVIFMPVGLTMLNHGNRFEDEPTLEEIAALVAAGMTGFSVNLDAKSRAELADEMVRFGDEVIARLPG